MSAWSDSKMPRSSSTSTRRTHSPLCALRLEVLEPELVGAALVVVALDLLVRAQLDAADLSGDRFRQRRELEPAHAVVWRQARVAVFEDAARRIGGRFGAGDERD